ncbi:hydroxycarboxylic acid receptor 3 [Stigmatopora nigra]
MSSTSSNVTPTPAPGGVCPPVGVQLEALILPPVLVVVVILGVLGNLVALWIFCFRIKSWNANIVFLLNLVVADFLALVSLPLRVDALLRRHWVFGDVMCRLNLFLMFSNRTASIALMTIIAFYRYFKVVHPHHRFNRMTKHQAALFSLVVWLLVSSPRIPLLAYNHIKGSGNKSQCFFFTSYKEASRGIIILVTMHRILTVLEFIIALVLLLFCSVRISRFLKERQMGKPEKVRKAMRVCIAIVVIFLVCFLPTTITTLGIWLNRAIWPWNCNAFYTLTQLNIVSLGLNFLNSALDPIVYVFSSTLFRAALVAAIPARLRCHQVEDSEGSSSTSQSTGQVELRAARASQD